MNPYLGHESQLSRVEEHRLVGGKGDGIRLLEVDNGIGLHLTLSPDRCCDISRLSFRGINLGYFSPCGYVAPSYYDCQEAGFLKSFTAGFLTTCGLQAVGSPCSDAGEKLPLHGSIGNIPAEHLYWTRQTDCLLVHAVINDSAIFARKLSLSRHIKIPVTKNEFTITDEILNEGDHEEPLEILYHMNIGYPLLDECSILSINSNGNVTPRDNCAAADVENWSQFQPPQAGYRERCYYHACQKDGKAKIWQPKLGMGLEICFDTNYVDCFTQWKMMGCRDYVLGLEPGNCYPDGRDVMRKNGILKFIKPGETRTYSLTVKMTESEQETF